MKLQSITIQGFKCFGENAVTVKFSPEITALIGTNNSGKTALFEALLRLFGVTREQRTLSKSDFYVSPLEEESKKSRILFIDARFVFPDIGENGESKTSIPTFFDSLSIEEQDGNPILRVRLEGTWTDDGTIDGTIDSNLYLITTTEDDFNEKNKSIYPSNLRGKIQVQYIPSVRDTSSLLKNAIGQMTRRLFRAISWPQDSKKEIDESFQKIKETFSEIKEISHINLNLNNTWINLHDSVFNSEPELYVIGKNFEEILKKVSVQFRPTEHGSERDIEELSDGQKSLFYIAFASAVFEIEEDILADKYKDEDKSRKRDDTTDEYSLSNYDLETLKIPELTIFALEEPENHLSPFFLSRIVKQLRGISQSSRAQTIFSSHSPSILTRIDPKEIRYFRLLNEDCTSSIKGILIPKKPTELSKYIREAVLSYPEIYFSRFVIFGEGDSEQIVIPRLAKVFDIDIDPSFVSVVPLGGRHVNHFWKLLNELDIPHATLLDLDLGRSGGGWGRIKYVLEQLLGIGFSKEELLKVYDKKGESILTDEELNEMHTWDYSNMESFNSWILFLEKYGVFFSSPLDLDFCMLQSYQNFYQKKSKGQLGPKLSNEKSIPCVLGESGMHSLYEEEKKNLFPWYQYLFLSKSKPATHMRVLANMSDDEIKTSTPPELLRLIKFVENNIKNNN